MTAGRPTQAEVDECMRMAREEQFGADDPTVYMRVLAAEVQALRESERVAWDNVNFPTPSNFVHCYPHKTAWVRGAPDEGCQACRLERELKDALRELDLFRAASEAAELRIVELREEVKFATARADDNEATVRRLMAAITRLEELCERWKARITADHWAPAACEVEAALRDQP